MAVRRGYVQAAAHVRKRIASRLKTLRAKPRPVSREWLKKKYWGEKLNMVQIGALLGWDPKTIWEWMKFYGIKTRPRGGFTSPNCFVKGQTSLFKGRRHTKETRARLSAQALADGRRPWGKSLVPYWSGRGGPQHPAWKGGRTPERQAFYASVAWKRRVVGVWKRDDAKCRRCRLDHRTVIRGKMRFHIHHIDSFTIRSRRAVLNNLLLLCDPCHRWIHSNKNKKGEYLGKGH